METWLVDIVVAFGVFYCLPIFIRRFFKQSNKARNTTISSAVSYIAVIGYILFRFVLYNRGISIQTLLTITVIYGITQIAIFLLPLHTHNDGLTLDHDDDLYALHREAGDYRSEPTFEQRDTFSDFKTPKKRTARTYVALFVVGVSLLITGVFLYIRFESPAYTIYLDSQGAGQYDSISMSGFESYTLPTPEKEDYYFAGWFDRKVGGVQYFGDEYSHSLMRGDKTLYAQWLTYTQQTITMQNYNLFLIVEVDFDGFIYINTIRRAKYTITCKGIEDMYYDLDIVGININFKDYISTFTREETRTFTLPYESAYNPDNLQVNGTIMYVLK